MNVQKKDPENCCQDSGFPLGKCGAHFRLIYKQWYRELVGSTFAKSKTLSIELLARTIWVEFVVTDKNDFSSGTRNADSRIGGFPRALLCALPLDVQISNPLRKMNKAPTNKSNAFTSLVLPLAIGLAMYMCINLMVDREVINNELLLRYLTGHPISKITTFMFCVGVAGLLLIANNVFDQFCGCDKIRLRLESEESESEVVSPNQRATTLMESMLNSKAAIRSHYLWQRLYGSLSFIQRTGNTSGLEEELKYLADLDQDRQQQRYSLIRIVIWATPMLGFLGTVLGISQALGGIQVGPDNDFQSMLNSLRGSLFVAFDTTALALTLSMLLMFLQFFVDRFEIQLLESVQRRTHEELLPLYKEDHFVDPQSRAVEKIGRTVLATTHQLVKQQTDQWEHSMRSAEVAWTNSVAHASETVQSSLGMALRDANIELADSITRGIERADDSMAKRWEQWQVMLSENARQINMSQTQILRQIDTVKELLAKIDSASGAQHMLNKNLDALAATSRLHETLRQLTKSIDELKSNGKPQQDANPASRLRIHRPDSKPNNASVSKRKAA